MVISMCSPIGSLMILVANVWHYDIFYRIFLVSQFYITFAAFQHRYKKTYVYARLPFYMTKPAIEQIIFEQSKNKSLVTLLLLTVRDYDLSSYNLHGKQQKYILINIVHMYTRT